MGSGIFFWKYLISPPPGPIDLNGRVPFFIYGILHTLVCNFFNSPYFSNAIILIAALGIYSPLQAFFHPFPHIDAPLVWVKALCVLVSAPP